MANTITINISPSTLVEMEEGEIVEDNRDTMTEKYQGGTEKRSTTELLSSSPHNHADFAQYTRNSTAEDISHHENVWEKGNKVRKGIEKNRRGGQRRESGNGKERREKKRKKRVTRKRARLAFESRVRTVCASGGCGNTLLVRGAPPILTIREFCKHAENAGANGALRVRTALLQGRRAFWLVYATHTTAAEAFDKMYGVEWSLRCGLRFVVRPILHDDSEDAESRKRRRRTLALGTQRSDGDILRNSGVVRVKVRPASAALEKLLKQEPQNCLFLKTSTT